MKIVSIILSAFILLNMSFGFAAVEKVEIKDDCCKNKTECPKEKKDDCCGHNKCCVSNCVQILHFWTNFPEVKLTFFNFKDLSKSQFHYAEMHSNDYNYSCFKPPKTRESV